MGLTEKVYILAGVTPMKSVGMARYMQLKVPGMDVPNEIIKRSRAWKRKKWPTRASRSPANRSRSSRR
jgi:methylenetetrahydrofolate reductase (NADPH)